MKQLTDWTQTLRYPVMGIILAILGLVMLLDCSQSPNQPLRVATIPWPGYETLHLAQSLDYFDNQPIRLLHMVNNSQAAMALRNRTADAAMLTLDEVLVLLEDGMDLRVILVMDISSGADVVMARPEIRDLTALRGKRVAVENAAVGALMLDAVLLAAGLTIDDIKLVPKTVNEHLDAYRRHQIDAVVTFEPVRSALLAEGAHVLFDSNQIPGRIIDVMAVRAEVMAEHHSTLKTLVAAHFRALAYQQQHPEDAASRIAPFLGIPAQAVPAQFVGIKIPRLSDNRALLAGTPPELKITATRLANLMLQRHLLERDIDVSRLAEPLFLPSEP